MYVICISPDHRCVRTPSRPSSVLAAHHCALFAMPRVRDQWNGMPLYPLNVEAIGTPRALLVAYLRGLQRRHRIYEYCYSDSRRVLPGVPKIPRQRASYRQSEHFPFCARGHWLAIDQGLTYSTFVIPMEAHELLKYGTKKLFSFWGIFPLFAPPRPGSDGDFHFPPQAYTTHP